MIQEAGIKRLKIYKAIYIAVALALILFNIITVIPYYELGVFFDGYSTWSQKLGYFLGRHLLIIFGLFLFLRAYFMNRKIIEMQNGDILDAIDEIGENR